MIQTSFPTIRVSRKAAGRLESGHLWIFRSDLTSAGRVEPGATVRVEGASSRELGFAHYSSTSQIALRMLGRAPESPGAEFYRSRLGIAAAYRRRVVQDSDAYRLVHAEGDLLPALIVDCYGRYLVVQALNQGMDRDLPLITQALVDLFQPAGILARNDAAVRTLEQLPRESTVLYGEIPEDVRIRMNSLALRVNLLHGMKTGVFLDQRENYRAAAKYASGEALDCFTSTGGFALHIAPKCRRVEAIDSSEPALAAAGANAEANQIANIRFRQADVFEALSGLVASGRRFDTVILDPPAFAKSRSHVSRALSAYQEINRRGIQLLAPGGMLVTCSCSHHVSEADLLGVIAQAGLEQNRLLRVVERRMQAQDHPVLLTVPETLYLKCIILTDLRAESH